MEPMHAPLWGWTRPARVLLAGLAAVLALALAARAPGSPKSQPGLLPRLVLDPNSAPPQVLTVLPGMGPTLLGRFLAARQERPFESLNDIDIRVRGVGPKTISAWRPYLQMDLPPGQRDPKRVAAADLSSLPDR